jgi:hypothetical protein
MGSLPPSPCLWPCSLVFLSRLRPLIVFSIDLANIPASKLLVEPVPSAISPPGFFPADSIDRAYAARLPIVSAAPLYYRCLRITEYIPTFAPIVYYSAIENIAYIISPRSGVISTTKNHRSIKSRFITHILCSSGLSSSQSQPTTHRAPRHPPGTPFDFPPSSTSVFKIRLIG